MSVFAFTLQLYLLASHIWDYRFAPEAVPDQEAEANYRCPLGPPSPANPLAFLDIEIGGDLVGRIVLELKLDVVPKTSQNFFDICNGEGPKGANYAGSRFHRVIKGFMCQGGITTSGWSFDDENFDLAHELSLIHI